MKYVSLASFAMMLLIGSAVVLAQPATENISQGNVAFENKDYPLAEKLFSQAIKQDPKNYTAYYNRAVCRMAQKNAKGSIADLTVAITLDPNSTQAYFNRGSAYAQTSDWSKSLADFDRALELDSTLTNAYYMRGQIFAQTGEFFRATQELKNYVARGNDSASVAAARDLLERLGYQPLDVAGATYQDDSAHVALTLPGNWFRSATDDGKTLNMFVSMQKVETESDVFTVGATIRRIRRLSKSLPDVPSDDKALAAFWESYQAKLAGKVDLYKKLSNRNITVGKYSGMLREIELRVKPEYYKVREYELILAHDDTIVTLILESPSTVFEQLRPTFDRAISSLHVE